MVMSDAEIERLYRSIEQLHTEVKEYRADLNGRLRYLEVHAAGLDAAQGQRVLTRASALAYIAGIASLAGIMTAVITNLL